MAKRSNRDLQLDVSFFAIFRILGGVLVIVYTIMRPLPIGDIVIFNSHTCVSQDHVHIIRDHLQL